MEGISVGAEVGLMEGINVGAEVGLMDGLNVGSVPRFNVGPLVGPAMIQSYVSIGNVLNIDDMFLYHTGK